MKEIGDMKLYTFEEVLDEHIGKPGTEERDSFEKSVEESVQAYKLGEAIRKARIEQHLTQSHYHIIRGTKDTLGVEDRKRGRSKYGAKRPKA